MIIKNIGKILLKFSSLLNSLGDKLSPPPPPPTMPIQAIRCEPWFADNGDSTHRLNYDLSKDSIVFDLGGYEGQWASDIYGMYNCDIYVFEPYLPFAEKIKFRFKNNQKFKVFEFGLGAKTEKVGFANLDNSSSMINSAAINSLETVSIVSVSEFLNENNINNVDLIKINIEGAEYELLESIIKNGQIQIFQNLQIQFHDFLFPNAKDRMQKIQEALGKTHNLTYYYEFVWENWKLK